MSQIVCFFNNWIENLVQKSKNMIKGHKEEEQALFKLPWSILWQSKNSWDSEQKKQTKCQEKSG